MRLGGFVIHGNNRATVARCVDDLLSVCDKVVAVDSYSTDGSFEIVKRLGAEQLRLRWQGYGSARAAAVAALGKDFDYVFFLDADECLSQGARQDIARWKHCSPTLPVYTVRRKNWASASTTRFVYRIDTRARFVMMRHALWRRDMIVHEALPKLRSAPSRVAIEHEFVTSDNRREEKDSLYALLWAIQNAEVPRRVKPAGAERVAHFLRDLLLGGAAARGGFAAARLAWNVARPYGDRYELLKAVRAGRFSDLLALYREDRLEELFERAQKAAARRAIPLLEHA